MADPGGVLGEIVARKRVDVAARLGGVGLAELRGRASRRGAASRAALAAARRALHHGGEEGLALGGRAPRRRRSGGAGARPMPAPPTRSACSPTGPFSAARSTICAAVRRVFDGPILAKDFIVDPRQVAEARLHGADAVLAMLSVLDDDEARGGAWPRPSALGMDALVEAHDEAEVRARGRARRAADRHQQSRPAGRWRSTSPPPSGWRRWCRADRLVVAESGIAEPRRRRAAGAACRRLPGRHRADARRATRPRRRARSPSAGSRSAALTNAADARHGGARRARAYAGLVMVPGTPRAVTAAEAEPIARAAREAAPRSSASSATQSLEQVDAAARRLGLDAVQLHGDEDAAYIAACARCCRRDRDLGGGAGRPRGARRRGPAPTASCSTPGRRPHRRHRPRLRLVAGRAAGRELGAACSPAASTRPMPAPPRGVGAWALDVGSGVEAAPGRKDPQPSSRAFFEALRPAARGEAAPC